MYRFFKTCPCKSGADITSSWMFFSFVYFEELVLGYFSFSGLIARPCLVISASGQMTTRSILGSSVDSRNRSRPIDEPSLSQRTRGFHPR